MNPIIDAIKDRRSIRQYQRRQIEDEKLEAILDAAIYAPSGHNLQRWNFLVIQDKEKIEDLDQRIKKCMLESKIPRAVILGNNPKYKVLHSAPTIVIVSGDEVTSNPNGNFGPIAECSAAIQNMLLAAFSLGIASCWIGFVQYLFAYPEKMSDIPIPTGYKPYYCVCLGYSDLNSKPGRPERRNNVIGYWD